MRRLLRRVAEWWRRGTDRLRFERSRNIRLDFIKVLRLQSGDVLVVRASPGIAYTIEQRKDMEDRLEKLLGRRNSVLVLDGQWDVEVIRQEETLVPSQRKVAGGLGGMG